MPPPASLTATRPRPTIPTPPVTDRELAAYLAESESKFDMDDADKEALRAWASRIGQPPL